MKPWDCLNDQERKEAMSLLNDIQTINTHMSDDDAREMALDLFLRGWHQ